MTGFSDLSNEVILEILHHVTPRDLDSACTITKSISLLAAPILKEHLSLKEQYSSSNNFQNEHHPLSQLLTEILAKPRIACYVRSLVVDCSLSLADGLKQPQESWFNFSTLQLIRTAIEKTGIVLANEVDAQVEAFHDSTDDQLSLALLLLHLSDLNCLTISLTAHSTKSLYKMTEAIRLAPAGTYFAHLKRVSIECLAIDFEHSGSARTDVTRFLVAVMALPTLDSLDAKRIVIRDQGFTLASIRCLQRINITDLSFFDCTIGAKTLFALLGKTHNLQSFGCVFSGQERSLNFRVDWHWLSVGLVHHTRHSLKKLRLQSNGLSYLDDVVQSLRELKVLREIRTMLPVFLDGWDCMDFRDMLPASIQKIQLSAPVSPLASIGDTYTELERIREVVRSILEVQKMLLPQLTEICVVMEPKWQSSVFASLFAGTSKACHSQGILFNMD